MSFLIILKWIVRIVAIIALIAGAIALLVCVVMYLAPIVLPVIVGLLILAAAGWIIIGIIFILRWAFG